jgi:hypothetical protein
MIGYEGGPVGASATLFSRWITHDCLFDTPAALDRRL